MLIGRFASKCEQFFALESENHDEAKSKRCTASQKKRFMRHRSQQTSALPTTLLPSSFSTHLHYQPETSLIAIMRVIEVIIDGFKSYAVRTVIAGWDAQFNSITGLNGSGKSNILDAICFVLGITNMSTVRAQNLQVCLRR